MYPLKRRRVSAYSNTDRTSTASVKADLDLDSKSVRSNADLWLFDVVQDSCVTKEYQAGKRVSLARPRKLIRLC